MKVEIDWSQFTDDKQSKPVSPKKAASSNNGIEVVTDCQRVRSYLGYRCWAVAFPCVDMLVDRMNLGDILLSRTEDKDLGSGCEGWVLDNDGLSIAVFVGFEDLALEHDLESCEGHLGLLRYMF